MTFKGTNWTRGDLGHELDPNPDVKCDGCGDSHPLEWWSERAEVPPPPEGFICPDCREVREREEANQKITEWCA